MSRYWGQRIVIDGTWYKTPGAIGALKPAPIPAPGVANSVVASYEYQTQEVLRKIENGSLVGRLVIKLINHSSRGLKIIPLAVDDFARTQAVPFKCVPVRCEHVHTDSIIWFEPSAWGSARTRAIDPRGNMQPDDVLLHEMVHSLRQIRGLFKPTPLGDGFQFVEELYAVLLTNMYVTEMGRPQSRRYGHSLPFVPLAAKGQLADIANEFYLSYQDEIDAFVREMPDLCAPLGSTSCYIDWNPIFCAVQRRYS